jgi:hypothetical protein
MQFAELSNDQRRQMIDAKQAFEPWREAYREFRHSYRGSMRWKTIKGAEYLYRKRGSVETSIGRRSTETEKIKEDYIEQRTRLRQRGTRLEQRLKSMEKINRAFGLGRMPITAARVLRKLDEVGLLGRQLFVVGTHSLYAYEARAGVVLDGGLTATTDVDLLIDARQHMSLAIAEDVRPEGVLGLLRRVDKSFERSADYRAINDEGYSVDLIAPMRRNEATAPDIRLGDSDDDLVAASILGLQWLLNAPKFEEVIVGGDGRPLWVCCIDPRAFALHKFWMSKRDDREPAKRRRDAAQAHAVTSLATDYLSMKFNAKDLTALPLDLVKCAKDLIASIRKK